MAPSTCCNISITKLGNIRDLRLYVASPERLLERPKLSNPIFSDYHLLLSTRIGICKIIKNGN